MEAASVDLVETRSDGYAPLLDGVRATFAATVSGGERLFMTDAEGLWSAYLDNLPAERQTHTCHACRRFVETCGGLVCIGADGTTRAALWDPDAVPAFYRPAVAALRRAVERARVTGVFLSKQVTLGTPRTGE